MPYSFHSPDFEPKDDDQNEAEAKLQTIGSLLYHRILTDDNPSSDGSTALDQIIAYVFVAEDPAEFKSIKEEIYDIAKQMEGVEVKQPKKLEEENNMDYITGHAFNRMEIFYKLGLAVKIGIVTDDVKSPWTGQTSLEQILAFEIGVYYPDAVRYIANNFRIYMHQQKGGCDLSEYENPFECEELYLP